MIVPIFQIRHIMPIGLTCPNSFSVTCTFLKIPFAFFFFPQKRGDRSKEEIPSVGLWLGWVQSWGPYLGQRIYF